MAVATSDEADLFLELISMFTGCHQQSQLFACSFVYPECTVSFFGSRTSSIKACRLLCESVVERCGFVFSYSNFTTAVNCSHFSEEKCTTEIVSGTFSCPAGWFQCGSSNECQPQDKQCDDSLDCADGSDEIGCSPGFIGRPGRPLEPTGEACTPITNQICQNLTYDETSFPNMAVATSDEADLFLELISMFTGCHQQSQLFACSFVYPECTASFFGSRTSSIKACRSLCESVLERCGFMFNYLNFTTAVNCSHFSEEKCTTEVVSGTFSCPAGWFQCGSSYECQPQDKQCDDSLDCADGSDEIGCSPGFIGRPGRPLEPTGEACTPITNQICQNLTYDETSFPNMAVATSDEADLFLELISMFTGCHQQSQLFACSFVYPECTVSFFGSRTSSIKACRSLCESVVERCGFVFSYSNFTTAVNCSHFSEEKCTTEIVSGTFSCPAGWFQCGSSYECQPQDKQCDDSLDCADGSDEIGCSPGFIGRPGRPLEPTGEACTPITNQICQNLTYDETSFPNMAVATSDEADERFHAQLDGFSVEVVMSANLKINSVMIHLTALMAQTK
ncbi:atrial natriuretic peptide-converting enzyme-like [Ptychodera flava]|uniref:atrial natriuretic peptide-converting enzyme-like n=1 Tax=Ptychodera flava TaxID=63121 RepID=UPI00396A3933